MKIEVVPGKPFLPMDLLARSFRHPDCMGDKICHLKRADVQPRMMWSPSSYFPPLALSLWWRALFFVPLQRTPLTYVFSCTMGPATIVFERRGFPPCNTPLFAYTDLNMDLSTLSLLVPSRGYIFSREGIKAYVSAERIGSAIFVSLSPLMLAHQFSTSRFVLFQPPFFFRPSPFPVAGFLFSA
jgi:hypothetical protein